MPLGGDADLLARFKLSSLLSLKALSVRSFEVSIEEWVLLKGLFGAVWTLKDLPNDLF